MIRDLIVGWYGEPTYLIFHYIYVLYPVWLPLLSAFIFWEVWVRYARTYFFFNTKNVLLEIRIPQDLAKSPMAMELVLHSFYQTGGEGTFIDRYWKGQTRPWFSLELVSHGGDVRFYVWCRDQLRTVIETAFYAQYPDIEIKTVDDYAKHFDYNPQVNNMWALNFELDGADPYPIKTYVDYGLDKDPDEEFKHDPLTAVIESLGSIKPGEHLWVQFIIRAHKSEKRLGFFDKKSDWKSAALKERDGLLAAFKKAERKATKGEEEIMHALERSVRKYPFDFAARGIYCADNRDLFNKSAITALGGLMRPFSTAGGLKGSGQFNGFKGANAIGFDYPWQDFLDMRADRNRRKMLDGYKRRAAFFPPHQLKVSVLNTEELATIFHLPGAVAMTPGLARIPSKRAQAPTNLPI